MDTDLDPARLLRTARERSGLSQRALARRAGTSQSVVARIELGRTSPTVPTLTRLLGAAGHRLEAHLVPAVSELVARARGRSPGAQRRPARPGPDSRPEMSYLVERLAELRRHLDHLRELRPRVGGPAALEADRSLHNDVLFSLLTVCQVVIDMAGDLAAREGLRFEDYTSAVRSLARLPGFPDDVVDELARLPGVRNVLVHGYVELDHEVVMRALANLEPVERFVRTVAERLDG